MSSEGLLDPVSIRALADQLALRPSKQLGQNFVHDANTVRRIVAAAKLGPTDCVLEVGPGLGSLTLGLLQAGAHVIAVEIDPVMAEQLPRTVAQRMPEAAERLTVIAADALTLTELPRPIDQVVANLPYNVAVPVILHLLAEFEWSKGLVMVQLEVAERLVATPGSKIYGIPSAKLAWYAHAEKFGTVSPRVFWPVPRVDSGLVKIERRPAPETSATREQVFQVIDAAFAQRRKMLRGALAKLVGSADQAEQAICAAGLDPTSRGETLDVTDFARIAHNLETS